MLIGSFSGYNLGMPHLALSLLGAFEAAAANQRITGFPTDKTRALLAYLALEANRPHQRLSLAGLFWPDMPDEAALNNLRKSLHRLHQTLDSLIPAGSDELFTVTRQTIQLNQSALTLDVATFQGLLAACEAHPHRHLHVCQPCLSRLVQAVGLYRGELLAGVSLGDAPAFEEWLLIRREALQHQVLVVSYQLTAAYEQRGEYEQAHLYAARQVALDPYREEAHQQMIRSLALSGQRSEALEQYAALRRLLAQELGVEPQPETIALYDKIRAEAQSLESTQDLKELSFKRELQHHTPILLHYFPVQFTPFVGRETELLQIQELLLDPDCRLLTVIGPGGIGKTRLGIEAMEQLAAKTRQFASPPDQRTHIPIDGIYFFPLAGVASADLLLAALSSGLGLTLQEELDAQTQVLDCLRAKHIWLVLDNFEHLMDGTPLLQDILAAAPQVQVLVTSRHALNVRAEWQFPVEGLSYPLLDEAAVDALAYSAVQLFVQTARRFRPGYSVSPDDAEAVIRICRLVQGAPLALEIAAFWMQTYDPGQIAEEISRNVNFLITALKDIPDRHRGMRAVFAHSWDLLTESEQLVMAQVSLFQGGFSLDTALAVTQATSQDIAALLDKSILKRNVEGRYEMHALLRQFAIDKLDTLAQTSALAAGARQRHSDYYLNVIADKETALYGGEPRSAVIAVQHRLDNIRQAWQWALDQSRLETLTRSLEGLGRFYELAGFFEEGASMMGRAAAQLQEVPARGTDVERQQIALVSHLLVWQGRFLDKQSRADQAIATAHQALALAVQVDAREYQAHAQSLLGELLPHKGEFEQAKVYQQQALDYYQEAGDERRRAHCLSNLGIIHWRSGSNVQALDCFQQSLSLQQAINNKAGLAQLMSSIAGVYFEQEDLDQALVYIQQAAQLYQAIGDRIGIANSWGNLALVYRGRGKYDLALSCNQKDLEASQEMGNRHSIAMVLGNRGSIYEDRGDFDQALAYHQQALQLEEELGNGWEIARHRAGLGAIWQKKNNSQQALAYLDQALPVLRAHGARYYLVRPLLSKAEILYAEGRFDEARQYNQEVSALASELNQKDIVLLSAILAARIDFVLGDRYNAQQQLKNLLEKTQDDGEQAGLNYELWKMTQDQAPARSAVALYRQLYRAKPYFEYKLRLEELLSGQAHENPPD